MTEGLAATFRLLATTDNEAAVRALAPALDSRYAEIRQQALAALLSRRSVAGHREILHRLHVLDDRSTEILQAHPDRLTAAIREALLSEDQQLLANACRAVLWFREYDLVAVVLSVLEQSSGPRAALAARTLSQLIDLLHEELSSPNALEGRRDPQLIRGHVATALEHSVGRFIKHKRREVVEAFILLTNRDNSTLKQVLQTPYHPAFLTVIDILSKSCHPGVLGLLLSFLDDSKAPSAALSVVARRTDLRFVQYLLRKIGREPSAAVAANLKRIDAFAWPRCGAALFDELDDLEQHAAVRAVMTSGTSRDEAFKVIEYLLLNGKRGGRRAAAQALDQFDGADANALALRALDDQDPQVQAHVVVQLRRRGIPGALSRLIEKIDSRHAVVRKAVRKSLAEFEFRRFLTEFDMLDDNLRSSTGTLVKKVDPQTFPLLKTELHSPIRTRRLRGLAIVRAIQCASELEASLLALLAEDEEPQVRAEAAAVLAQCKSAASLWALQAALEDRSPLVRQAARTSLEERAETTGQREMAVHPTN